MFPNFLVIGAQKCGTTTLYDLLIQHPQIGMSKVKEPHFFDHEAVFARGEAWYSELFSECRDKQFRGEATPHYYRKSIAAERIAACIPDAKLILILRNPVDRAHSNYWFNVSRGVEPMTFDEAIRAKKGSELYVGKGFYAKYVKLYWGLFDRSQLHICFLEDLKREPQAEMAAVFAFLGADPEFPVAPISSNPTRVPRNALIARLLHVYQSLAGIIPGALRARIGRAGDSMRERYTVIGYRPMSPEAKSYLIDVYRDANAELGALLGRDLSAWNE